ncbi:hypothetical protein CR203_07180 [Salipaludibacillus neizhouensis]|uniref:Uncharacterized protein n=1 Tax=Salipaludibacillus neizhouensis TaxID=885475 RepID=A0A3A9K9L9_9BACI|nr:hypothetical protein [Salipaludibacillus neizhouensis]RKL68258.1 hypothetical protein CR203_07180 [Salipaludibacillus neizhouensis]
MARLLVYKHESQEGVVVVLDIPLKDTSGKTYYSAATLLTRGAPDLELIVENDERIIHSKQHHSYLYPYLTHMGDREILGKSLMDFYSKNEEFLG